MKPKTILRLASHPFSNPYRIYANFMLNRFETIRKKEVLKSQPTNISIEVTTRCNLKCKMCDRTYWPETHLNRDMTFDEFREIVDQIPKTYSIFLTGTGETLLNPEIFRMLEYLKGKEHFVGFTDNFSLMTAATSKRLMEIGVDSIIVSIDGGTKEVYEEIRRGARFETFKKNLEDFMQNKKELNSKIEICSSTVVTKDNEGDLENINKLLDAVGITGRNFNPMGFSDYLQERKDIFIDMGKAKPFSSMACTIPFNNPIITYNGLVVPCCVLSQHGGREKSKFSFGSMKEKRFMEIWNGEDYREMRRKIIRGELPEICSSCPYFRAV